MKYLICQEWKNTKGNHAGMVHLCKLINNKNPVDYKLIIVPDIIFYFPNKLLVSIQFKIQPYIYNLIYFFIFLNLVFKIKKGDSIFLFEYLLKERNQYFIARILKFIFGNKITIYGLAHLTPTRLESIYTKQELLKCTQVIDYNLTLGSSLTDYLIKNGTDKEKVITTFHYVDTNYYYPVKSFSSSDDFTVIVMGIQMRDFTMISNIVKANSSIKFIICQAFFKMDSFFENCTNVEFRGFMSENKLKEEIDRADISLNLMIDTVGSNVITTCMAMGLALVVSDVGSIKDYCDEENAIFCKNEIEFNEGIKIIKANKELLLNMQKSSLQKSSLFKFENFYKIINTI